MIRKSTNLLLTRTLSHCLQYAIKKKNVGLAEVCAVCKKIFRLILFAQVECNFSNFTVTQTDISALRPIVVAVKNNQL